MTNPRPRPYLAPHTLLTAEEEHVLGERVRAGDVAARDELVVHNRALVVRIAKDFTGRGLDFDDLVGEGNLGLMRAAQDFDVSHGTRFSTYASYWIKEKIHSALINRTAMIRVPAHAYRLLDRWRRTERAMATQDGGRPTAEAVSAQLGLSAQQSMLVARAHAATTVARDGDRARGASSLEEAVATSGDMDDGDELSFSVAALRAAIEKLTERDRAVLAMRYGLGGETVRTFSEVGQAIGTTKQGACQVEKRATAELRWLMGE